MEKTLIVLKPDTVKRGLVGEIITRFEKAGLKIVAVKMVQPDEDHYYHHYEDISKMVTRRGKEAFEVTLKMMQEGPVVAILLEGIKAVSLVRKMVGDTEPEKALPGTIRGDYAHMGFEWSNAQKIGVPNIIHASGDPDEAKLEISHWFSDEEIHDEYETVHEVYTQAKRK
ncbi:MAG: nucleoside-diphosphate kinase [bacterium]|nr:nucleoside-diphosphate kinase [bacterium]